MKDARALAPAMLPQKLAPAVVLLVIAPALLPAPAAGAGEPTWSVTLAESRADEDAFVLVLAADPHAPYVNVSVTLHVNHTAPDGASDAWHEDAGSWRALPNSTFDARLAPSRGAGTYVVDVAVPGASAPSELVLVAPDAAPANSTLSLDVADEPTLLAFTSDSVNAAGKTKVPGDALVTRVDVSDANGLDDVESLTFAYARFVAGEWRTVAETRLAELDGGNASVLADEVEHRFTEAPIPAGDYLESVIARSRAGEITTITRAFHVTDPRPQLVASTPLDPAVASPDVERTLNASIVLGDKNFGTGPLDAASVPGLGVVTARVYRGSVRVDDDAGWSVAVGGAPGPLDLTGVGHRDAGFDYRVVDGFGALALPLTVTVPAGAASADYRVSVYHAENATASRALLGSFPFSVQALPRISSLAVEPAVTAPGGRLTVAFTVDDAPAERVEVRLLRWRAGEWLPVGDVVSAGPDAGDVLVDVPRDVPPGAYAVEVAPAVAADAPALTGAAARAEVRLDAGPPALRLRGAAGATRVVAGPNGDAAPVVLGALNFSLDDANVTWTLTTSRGAAEPADARVARDAGGAFSFDATGLAPGRYRLRVDADTPAGRVTTQTVLDVGAWLAIRTGPTEAALAPAGGDRLAADVPLASEGNAPLRAAVVVVDPLPDGRHLSGDVALVDASGVTRATARLVDGRARLTGNLLAPGEDGATLRVELARPPGLDAGALAVNVHVHAALAGTAA